MAGEHPESIYPEELTASVSDLDTSLTNVHRNDFTHFRRELKTGKKSTIDVRELGMGSDYGQYSQKETDVGE